MNQAQSKTIATEKAKDLADLIDSVERKINIFAAKARNSEKISSKDKYGSLDQVDKIDATKQDLENKGLAIDHFDADTDQFRMKILGFCQLSRKKRGLKC